MKKQLHLNWNIRTDQIFTLNLDAKFDPFTDIKNRYDVDFDRFSFAGGEPHLKLNINEVPDNAELYISQRFNDVRNIFDILMSVDAARRLGFQKLHLVLPAFPAARQDRVCNEGEALTVKLFTDLVNGCNFASVHILSPHSEVTPALLNNVVVHNEHDYVQRMIADSCPKEDTINIVCPDAGAGKRVGSVVKFLSERFPQNRINLIRCEKVRDVKTGELLEFSVAADNLGGHPTYIIDDILCMGGTFRGLGEILKTKNCGRLYLFVSHCDCVAGVQKMIEFFDGVYTTNSKGNWDDYSYTMDCKVKAYKFTL